MRKKLLLSLMVAVGVAALVKRRKDAKDERDLWHEATDASDLK